MATTALDSLVGEIRSCRICVDSPRSRRLPHEPRPVLRVSRTARLAIAGQAPGTRVHASGTPFTDPSGDRLRDWMAVTPDEFYDVSRVAVIPMGFCFPGLNAQGGDLPPRPECAPHWRARLLAKLPQLDLILLVGLYAQRWHLDGSQNLTETVRDWRNIARADFSPRVFPLPHPSWRNNAWLKSNPWFERDLLPDLRAAVRDVLDRKSALP